MNKAIKHVRAAVLRSPGKLGIETLLLDHPRKGEVLVKVDTAGLCHSDLNFITGHSVYPYPVVLGHEGSGFVEYVGESVIGLAAGDKIVFNSGPSCGMCRYCERNQPSLCSTYSEANWKGSMLDGTYRLHSAEGEDVCQLASVGCFSTHIVVPEVCCVKLKSETQLDHAALLGCAVVTGIGAVNFTAKVRPQSNIVVLGIGGVGCCCLMALNKTNPKSIVAIDSNPLKSHIALELGATHFLESNNRLRHNFSLINGAPVDYVFDCSGAIDCQNLALEILGPGGVATFVGIGPSGKSLSIDTSILTRRQQSICGCYYGTLNTVREIQSFEVELLKGRLPLQKIITHKVPLDEINTGFQYLTSGEAIRVLLSL
jgi:Zn-dependent alcohol dehydrogenase